MSESETRAGEEMWPSYVIDLLPARRAMSWAEMSELAKLRNGANMTGWTDYVIRYADPIEAWKLDRRIQQRFDRCCHR